MKKIYSLLFFGHLSLFFGANICWAQSTQTNGITLQVPIFSYAVAKSLPEYIAMIFEFSLIVLVVLAISVIMISGVDWLLAAGNQQKIANARKRISSAFLGLLLGILSYMLLSFVGISTLYMPSIQSIAAVSNMQLATDAPDNIGNSDICVGLTSYNSNDECKSKESKCATQGCVNNATNKYCCIDKPAKAIYVHWSAGGTSANEQAYTFAVTGDGVVHQNYSETEGTNECTWHRNGPGNICVSGMGAYNFDKNDCYVKGGSLLGDSCDPKGRFNNLQITAIQAKVQELKTKYNIPALTHSQAALQDRYHCYVNPDPAVIAARGKYGCKFDWYPFDNKMN